MTEKEKKIENEIETSKPIDRSSFNDSVRIRGHIIAEKFDADGKLVQREEVHNLVTTNGFQYIATLFYSQKWDAANAMKNFKLGSASTAASISGPGSFVAVADYVSGSATALDEASPKQGASAVIVTFINTWAAGEITPGVVRRAGITNNATNAGEADATGTLAMGVFAGDINMTATDTLKLTWNLTIEAP